ncbi:MAG: hypothetical protein ACI35S_03110 [Anaeroplasma sp.]
MFKLYNWKQPLYRNDLISVLVNGLLTAILAGVLAGALDFLFSMINFPLAFGLLIICYLVAYKVKKSFYSYHILYPVLSLIFMVIALFISDVTKMCMIYNSISALPTILSTPSFYLAFILGPLYYFYICIKSFDVIYLFLGIIDIIIYVWAFMICYKTVKGRN